MKFKMYKFLFTVLISMIVANSAFAKTKITWWNYSDEGGGLDATLKEMVQDKFNASQNDIELEIIF